MQTHWQMLWPGFRPVWQFPLLREHIRMPSLWTTGIATDYSAFNHLRRLLLACDLVAWVCTFKVFTMIAFRALVWRQTATLWWRTRETTAWRSTSISSRPSSTWSEDLQVSPEDRHLLGLWYFKWSLVVWRVDVLFMIATVNDHNHYTEVHRWEWSSIPVPHVPRPPLSKFFLQQHRWRQFEGKSYGSSSITSRSSSSTNIASQDIFI